MRHFKLRLKQTGYLFFSIAFLVLWLVFMVRENKEGEYRELKYLYTHSDIEKRRCVMLPDEYDYLSFCKKYLPADATYKTAGLEDLAFVQARYMLWPARVDLNDPEFILVFKSCYITPKGYSEFARFQDKGFIIKKRKSQ